MIDYNALHERCRREGKSTLDLDDLAAGHPIAEAELAEQRYWLECRYHGHDYEACEKYSGQVPCDHEALGAPEPAPAAVPEVVSDKELHAIGCNYGLRQYMGVDAHHFVDQLKAVISEAVLIPPAPAEVPETVKDEEFAEEFEQWWEEHGQFVRSGGGQYEKTFAFQAFRYLMPEVLKARQHASPAPAEPKEE